VRPRCKWEGNVKIDCRKMVLNDVIWIDVVQDRVHCWAFVKTVMVIRVLIDADNFLTG
jgi:hypothetical protein